MDAFEDAEADTGWKRHICVVPGDFVTPATTLAEVWAQEPEDEIADDIRLVASRTSATSRRTSSMASAS